MKTKTYRIDYFCSMTVISFPFKVLFCFEDEQRFIVEIKRLDIQSEDKGLVYFWLCISKKSTSVEKLTFKSMEQTSEKQTRNFEEGTLIWTSRVARFNEEIVLQIANENLANTWLKAISNYLDCCF